MKNLISIWQDIYVHSPIAGQLSCHYCLQQRDSPPVDGLENEHTSLAKPGSTNRVYSIPGDIYSMPGYVSIPIPL
jgi:hypothetical protein